MYDIKEPFKTLAKDYIILWNWKQTKLFNLHSGQAIRSSFLLLRSAVGCLVTNWVKNSDLLNFQGYTYSVIVIHLDMRGNFNKTKTKQKKKTPN